MIIVRNLERNPSHQPKETIKKWYSLYHTTRILIFDEITKYLDLNNENNEGIREKFANITQNIMNRFLFLCYFYFDQQRDLSKIFELNQRFKGSYNIWKELCKIFQEYNNIYPGIGLFDLDLLKEKIIIYDINEKKDNKEIENDTHEIPEKIKENINPIYTNIVLISNAIKKHEITIDVLMKILEIAIVELDGIANTASALKSHGIYYTPQFIVDFMVESILMRYLSIDINIGSSIDDLICQYTNKIEDLIQKIKELRIIDPSCGSGIFLITSLEFLQKIYRKIFEYSGKNKIKTGLMLQPENFADIITYIAEQNIYGVDIMPIAVEIAKLLIYIRCKLENAKIPNLSNNIKRGNSLLSIEFNWKKNFKKIFVRPSHPGFNVVIGNPPWGGSLKMQSEKASIYSNNFTTAIHQFDSFSLFIELSITSLLANKGYFSFIIPNELCTNRSFAELRKLLMDKTKILEIVNLGEDIFESVNRPCMILILQKQEVKKEKHKDTFIEIRKGYSAEHKQKLRNGEFSLRSLLPKKNNSIEIYKRTYYSLYTNEYYIWDIFRTEQDKKIIDKIRNNPRIVTIGDVMKNGRGFDINKDGKYILCLNCNTGNPFFGRGNSRVQSNNEQKKCINCGIELKRNQIEGISEKNSQLPKGPTIGIVKTAFSHTRGDGPTWIQIAVGEDIAPLYLHPPSRFLDLNNPDLKMFDLKLKQADHLYKGERIFIRKVGKPLVATIVNEDMMCNDQCYVWKYKKEYSNYSYHYCLAILLSDFQYYYYSLQTGNLEKKIFPHFRQEDIKRFPFPLVDFNTEQKVLHDSISEKMKEIEKIIKHHIENTNETQSIKGKKDQTKISKLKKEINELVFKLFDIGLEDMNFIQKKNKS